MTEAGPGLGADPSAITLLTSSPRQAVEAATFVMSRWTETHRGIVRPEDCDLNRHMNVKGFFDRFGSASGYLLKQAGLYYSDVVRSGYGVGTVANTIRYRRELVDGDAYVIESAFVRLGRSSFRHVHKMVRVSDALLSASSDMTEVLFDLHARASAPLSGEMRAGIEARLVILSEEDARWFG